MRVAALALTFGPSTVELSGRRGLDLLSELGRRLNVDRATTVGRQRAARGRGRLGGRPGPLQRVDRGRRDEGYRAPGRVDDPPQRVHLVVAAHAQENSVAQRGPATHRPMNDVVRVAPGRRSTAHCAASVALCKGALLSGGEVSFLAQVEALGLGAEDRGDHASPRGETARRARVDGPVGAVDDAVVGQRLLQRVESDPHHQADRVVGKDIDIAALHVAREVAEGVGAHLLGRPRVLNHRNALLRQLRVVSLELKVLLDHGVQHRHQRKPTLGLEPCVDPHHAVVLFLDEAVSAFALRLGTLLGTLGIHVALPPQHGLDERVVGDPARRLDERRLRNAQPVAVAVVPHAPQHAGDGMRARGGERSVVESCRDGGEDGLVRRRGRRGDGRLRGEKFTVDLVAVASSVRGGHKSGPGCGRR